MKTTSHDKPPGGRIGLVIGMVDSIHLARWLKQFSDSDNKFFILPSGPNRIVHPVIRDLANDFPNNFVVSRFLNKLSLGIWLGDLILFRGRLRALSYLQAIKRHRPDFIHIFETQNGAYPLLHLRKHLVGSLKDIHIGLTPYGSDFFWFMRFTRHREKLSSLLEIVSHLFCECERDVKLAISLGFNGEFAPISPAFGSFVPPRLRKKSRKKRIMVKGYQNKWGQGEMTLRGIELIAPSLTGFELIIYSAEGSAHRFAKRLKKKYPSIDVQIFKKNTLSHDQVTTLMSEALLYVSASKSDGISASMIEAMAYGAFPIQTDSSCASEWFQNETGGILLRSDGLTSEIISQAILDALKNPVRLESARRTNHAIILDKFASSSSRDEMTQFYKSFTGLDQ